VIPARDEAGDRRRALDLAEVRLGPNFIAFADSYDVGRKLDVSSVVTS